MRNFNEFLGTNEVRRTTRDVGLARSLRHDAEQRVELILQLPLNEKSATLVFEQVYEALRECGDALLSLEGFKSYSHAATIAFLERYGDFSASELNRLDNARQKRNLSKYYAKQSTVAETQELIALYKHIKPRLDSIFNRLV